MFLEFTRISKYNKHSKEKKTNTEKKRRIETNPNEHFNYRNIPQSLVWKVEIKWMMRVERESESKLCEGSHGLE